MMNIKEELIIDESIDIKDQYIIQDHDDKSNGDASNQHTDNLEPHLFGEKSENEGIQEVQQLLRKWRLQDLCNGFFEHRIDTFALERLIESDIRDLVPCVGLRVKFRFALQEYILNIGREFGSVHEKDSTLKSSSSEKDVPVAIDILPEDIVVSDSSETGNEVPAKRPRLSSPTEENSFDFSACTENADVTYFGTIRPKMTSPVFICSSPEPSTSQQSYAAETPISTIDAFPPLPPLPPFEPPPLEPPPPPPLTPKTKIAANMLRVIRNSKVKRKEMQLAMRAVLNKGLEMKTAAETFRLSLNDLKYNLAATIFTEKEEALLAEMLKNQNHLPCNSVIRQAQQLHRSIHVVSGPVGLAGCVWLRGFLSRNPNIKVKNKPLKKKRKRTKKKGTGTRDCRSHSTVTKQMKITKIKP